MEIRKYMADDYHGIIDLTEDTYRVQLDGFLKHPECLSICVSGGKAVGWSYLTLPEDALGACFIYIYVAPAFRRRGAGRAMYEEILERIPDRKLERWSSYMPLEAADRFALAMGFDYVNTNSYMKFAGEFTDARDGAIRPYTDEDYPAGPDIWTEEYARMHRMLGLPYSMPDRNDE